MGAGADLEKGLKPAAGAVPNGKVSDGEKKEVGSGAPLKPTVAKVGGMGNGAVNGMLTNDEVTNTLAAASEKLQAAHMKEQKEKSSMSRCFGAMYPKKWLIKFRDMYINTCMMAAEKGDLVDLVAGHPGMIYGDSVMSRNVSMRKDQDEEEMLQASLSRQISISLSRQQSQSGGTLKLGRSASTGIQGLSRSTSAGIAGLNRQTSTGHRASFGGRSASVRKESNLYSAGRNTFLQQLPAANGTGQANSASNTGSKGPWIKSSQETK